MKHTLHNLKKQSGFTLLESMMALFVLTIGILGVAGMQMQSMRAGSVAKQRMMAVSYAEEMLERIRANPAGVDAYSRAPVSNGCTVNAKICTEIEMAEDDLFIWQAGVKAALPGTPTVEMIITPVGDPLLDPDGLGRNISVDISWDDRDDTYFFNTAVLINIVRAN